MNFSVNVEKICEFLEIQVEEFNGLTVWQIEEAKARIEQQEIEDRRKCEEIMEDYRFFFEEYDFFVQLFGKEFVDKYLPIIPLNNFKEKVEVRKGAPVLARKSQYIGDGTGYFPVLRGPGSRSGRMEYAPANIYYASSKYQGLQHSKLISPIFKEKYPWLSEFKISIYEIGESKGNNEFYLSNETNKSLYVPFQAFVEGDIESIKARNLSYLSFFNGKRSNQDAEEILNSPTVKKFFACMEENK